MSAYIFCGAKAKSLEECTEFQDGSGSCRELVGENVGEKLVVTFTY
jgi:hypothetical protein